MSGEAIGIWKSNCWNFFLDGTIFKKNRLVNPKLKNPLTEDFFFSFDLLAWTDLLHLIG